MHPIAIYAHRGGAGLLPENSLPACRAALAIGVDALDIDLALSADDVVIAYHDLLLNPGYTTNSRGQRADPSIAIRQLAYADIQHYHVGLLDKQSDYGQQFPHQLARQCLPILSLDDLIKALKPIAGDRLRLQLEMKSEPALGEKSPPVDVFAAALLAVLTKHQLLGSVEIHSFDWAALQALQQLSPDVITTYITSTRAAMGQADASDACLRQIKHLGGKGWCPDFIDVTKEKVKLAHQLGLRVIPWTVDKETDIIRMVDAKVDGIISNRPDIVRGVLAAHGAKLPRGVM